MKLPFERTPIERALVIEAQEQPIDRAMPRENMRRSVNERMAQFIETPRLHLCCAIRETTGGKSGIPQENL